MGVSKNSVFFVHATMYGMAILQERKIGDAAIVKKVYF
ncbi:MAG: hypothetical protein ACI8XX_002087 [Polaribacter sp.]